MFDPLKDVATHLLGVTQFVEGIEHKFALDFTALEDKYDARMRALEAKMSGGSDDAKAAIDAVGTKLSEMKGETAAA